jgi:hypothetical protein
MVIRKISFVSKNEKKKKKERKKERDLLAAKGSSKKWSVYR